MPIPETGAPLVGRPDPAIIHIRLNEPARLNPFSRAATQGIQAGLDAANADPSCRVIVIDGAGGHFSAGGDIAEMPDLDPVGMRKALPPLHHLIRTIVEGPKPVIAAVEGHCAGAGNALAAACDIVVASTTAKFTCSFVRIGLMPDMGALWTLPRRMGLGRARLFAMTAERLDSKAALAAGLADVPAEDGEALTTALSLAGRLATLAPQALARTKRLLADEPVTLARSLELERELQADLAGTADFREGVAAFQQKRPPRFTGD
jgi:enoyl-CoA hydratase/carnithine racemase